MGFHSRKAADSARPAFVRYVAGLVWAASLTGVVTVFGQTPDAAVAPPGEGEPVVDVRVVGNEAIPLHKIAPHIRTRAGRAFSADLVEDDVRRITKTRQFVNVTTTYQRAPEGVIVIFQVVERPTLRYVRYLGATLRRSTLDKHSGIKVGDAVDPYLVEEARRKLEEHYKSKGHALSRVSVVEGIKPGDRGAVFLINEGPRQKVYDVEFEGNTIAEDARLKTQIRSKPPILMVFGGGVDREKIQGDLESLTAYYRSLGYFSAKISHEVEFNDDNEWATLRFVINEGPRYKVRSVAVVGASQFPTQELENALQLKNGKFFDQNAMTRDVSGLQDRYGGIGYVYCNVQADPRFLEQPGELDLVYQIQEGDRYKVGRIDVRIEGDAPHTRVNTVLNRIDLRPGDIVDTRKIRDSERRLQASGLFMTDRAQGIMPRITWQAPDGVENVAQEPEDTIRGQSPDQPAGSSETWQPQPGETDRPLVLTFNERSASPAIQPDPDNENQAPRPPLFRSNPPARPDATVAPTPQKPGLLAFDGAAITQWPSSFEDAQRQIDEMRGPTWTGPSDGQGNPFAGEHRRSSVFQPTPEFPAAPEPPTAPVFAAPPTSVPAGMPQHDGLIFRGQSPQQPSFGSSMASPSGAGQVGQVPLGTMGPSSNVGTVSYQPGAGGSGVVPVQYTQPSSSGMAPVPGEVFGSTSAQPAATSPFGPPGTPVFSGQPAPGYGSGSDLSGAPAPYYEQPARDLTLTPRVQEAQTGRFMLGVGINSNAGLLGNIVIDEQNADLMRWPTSFRDLYEGRAFRGAGQQVRLEAVPGTQVSRYTFIFRQPYLFDTRVQFSGSGYYFQRFYNNWKEERLGGRVGLGYQMPHIPDLSFNSALRLEQVDISNPTVPTPNALQRALGSSGLYVAEFSAVHDTRDNPFLATQGHRVMLGFDLGFGEYDFPRGTVDARQHFLLGERPDGSGRQVLTLQSQLGITGSQTPIFENYFAGGFSSLRGFNFRGVGPRDLNVNIGGQFQWLNTVEYMFSITADDMVRGVAFCDFGTVERDISLHADNFRVAPGLGLRLTVPAMGPAPIAIDFTVPVLHAPGDDIQNIAFYVGFGR